MRLTLPNRPVTFPSILQRRTIALSIEGEDIRVLVTRGNSVVSWEDVRLEPGLVKEGIVADPEGLGAALKSVLDSPA
ncbi:MAG: hypothetical protein IMZ46_05190, partial [Acidobacteria bacterium]|nr:hypothetical protein [Acidobacteriota bacterium]